MSPNDQHLFDLHESRIQMVKDPVDCRIPLLRSRLEAVVFIPTLQMSTSMFFQRYPQLHSISIARLGAGKLELTSGILLTAGQKPDLTADERYLANEPCKQEMPLVYEPLTMEGYHTAAASFHHDSSMSHFLSLSSDRHDKLDVLQSTSLRNLPVYAYRPAIDGSASDRVWHLGHIELEVANLTVEVVLICPPLQTICAWYVKVGVEQRDAFEILRSHDSWLLKWVTNEGRVIVFWDWRVDSVNPWREIYDGSFLRCTRAIRVTAVFGHAGLHYERRVVLIPFTTRTKQFDVTKDLVTFLTRVGLLTWLACDKKIPNGELHRAMSYFVLELCI